MNDANAAPAPLSNAEKLWRIRHSASHVMATAVQQLFPEAKFAIGPPIENGFRDDFGPAAARSRRTISTRSRSG